MLYLRILYGFQLVFRVCITFSALCLRKAGITNSHEVVHHHIYTSLKFVHSNYFFQFSASDKIIIAHRIISMPNSIGYSLKIA